MFGLLFGKHKDEDKPAAGFGATVRPVLQQGRKVCKKGFRMLSHSERKYLTQLLDMVPDLGDAITRAVAFLAANHKSITADAVIAYLQSLLALLHDEAFLDRVSGLMEHYGQHVFKSKHFYAVGKYLRCIMAQLDDKYANILLLSAGVIEALVKLANRKSLSRPVLELHRKASKYILVPVLKDIGTKSENYERANGPFLTAPGAQRARVIVVPVRSAQQQQ
jgi:hypothetical protein